MRVTISAVLVFFAINLSLAQTSQEKIRISQIGYYPNSEKIAVVVGGITSEPFYVITVDGMDTVFTGTLSGPSTWSQSGETIRRADFSALDTWGGYRINVPSVGNSYYFFIAGNIHEDLMIGVIKGFYFQRASTKLLPAHAGQWAREAGHPDDFVYIHSSVVSDYYLEGEFMIGGSPKGWYDAGDYNKYIVNSGITTYSLLSLYEHFPAFFKNVNTNIPESNNALPDLLDEVLWNLEWMLTMQDPSDGGVSHKLTSTNFSGTIMPKDDVGSRYYIMKTTTATLDFAAVMAIAARVFKDYESVMPGFADKCEQAAYDAWNWARKNPNILYNQNTMNNNFNPDIYTGSYGDWSASDEFDWAAAELYITSKADTFFTMTNLGGATPNVSGWQNVAGLPFISLAHNRKNLTAIGYADTIDIKDKVISLADGLVGEYESSPYKVAVNNGDFYWGHNSVIANKGIMLMQAYYLTKNQTYLEAAMSTLYYLTGRNALGYCMVTGYGDKSPKDPHHRISEADGITKPVPGLLVGGPNAGAGDGCSINWGALPAAKRYLDDRCSYSTNEIAINWNAAISYLVGSIEAVQQGHIPGEWSAITSDSDFEEEINAVVLYPNPTTGKTFIKTSSEILSVTVFDMTGSEVHNVELITGNRLYLTTEVLPPGLYFLSIETNKGVVTKKLVKQ